MPRRPPKKWFYSTVKAIRKSRIAVDDPEALTAWIWYHHMRPEKKVKILKAADLKTYAAKYLKGKDRGTMARKKRRQKIKRKYHRKLGRVIKHKKQSRKKGRSKMDGRKRRRYRRGFEGRRRHYRRGFDGFDGRRSRRGKAQIVVMGRRGRRRGRRRGLLMGGTMGTVAGRIGTDTLNVAAGVAGGVGGAYLSTFIPGKDARIKAGITALAGIALASTVRMPVIRWAGMGMGIMAGLSLVNALAQQIPIKIGAAAQLYLPNPAPSMGAPADFTYAGDSVSHDEY